MQKAGDWLNQRIVTTEGMANGYAHLKAGTSGIVTKVSSGKLQLRLVGCKKCGIEIVISKVSYHSVCLIKEVLDEQC